MHQIENKFIHVSSKSFVNQNGTLTWIMSWQIWAMTFEITHITSVHEFVPASATYLDFQTFFVSKPI